MLPSSQRLTRQQFTDLLKKPEIKVIFNRLGTLKFVNQSNNGTLKNSLSIVTGSKQQKKAVLRNTLRRRIYAIFAKNPYKISISGILYVSKQAYTFSYQELESNLYALLSKIDQKNKENS